MSQVALTRVLAKFTYIHDTSIHPLSFSLEMMVPGIYNFKGVTFPFLY